MATKDQVSLVHFHVPGGNCGKRIGGSMVLLGFAAHCHVEDIIVNRDRARWGVFIILQHSSCLGVSNGTKSRNMVN